MLARASSSESTAILAIALAAGLSLLTERLPAQVTHTFSSVIELGDGRVAAADATLIDDATVSFTLMAPGLDLEWVEIRDREPGGTVLATTRSTGAGRAPHLQLIGMGEVLNEAGADVTIGLEDLLVELTLHAPGGGLVRAAEAGVVVVGFTDGQSTSFPIVPADLAGEGAGGAAITMAPMDDHEVFAGAPGENAAVGAAVAREAPTVAPPQTQAPPPVAPRAPPALPQAVAPRPAAPGPAVPPAQAPAAGTVVGNDWLGSATALRGRNGERFLFRCPPGGSAGRGPFGGDVYADHSSVCTAAVHAGLLSFASGGTVTIEIRPGQDAYPASPGQGGVTSAAAGAWPGSFSFVR